MSKKRIAIVGAGISGLSALKEARAEGHDAVCFDGRTEVGGAWAYQDVVPHQEGELQSSIYYGTVMNSCRDTSAFSDFPFDPARYPDYLSHRLLAQYLREYAAHFELVQHIQLGTKVVQCVPVDNGQWTVTTLKDGTTTETTFDAVIVAAGHLSKPRMPADTEVPGQGLFGGRILHSHVYRTPAPFEGKRVAIVGFGSSAVDVACEIAPHADACYVVTRRGGWVLPRYILGKPTEAFDNRATQMWLPTGLSQWVQTKLLNFVQGAHPPEMQPDHKILEQSPTVRGDFIEKVRTGIVHVKRADVTHFTASGIAITSTKGGKRTEELDVDVVIFATGYELFDIPYLPEDVLEPPLRDSAGSVSPPPPAAQLYRYIHPRRYPTLFFHGYVELFGPLLAASEAQGRYTAALLSGKLSLPPVGTMQKELDKEHAWRQTHLVQSERHNITAYQLEYIDTLLRGLGAAPTFGRLLKRVFTGNPFRALAVLNAVWFSIPSSAQWRLVGHGANDKLATATILRTAAEEAVLRDEEVAFLT
ncbi:dimethylaniline monooxygenase [Ophiostoma piceae UAMH 11346]|uniref:Flavin-containing monooxygenase 1 n=1 Tax=Ophiostoma piceae (strain UAMH 11346) TaxID=1262450 RepID=S3C8Z8_OPHP1|nr:dimethylaniline monooxygenase [Ophiostoma piceae UAMH 11346]